MLKVITYKKDYNLEDNLILLKAKIAMDNIIDIYCSVLSFRNILGYKEKIIISRK